MADASANLGSLVDDQILVLNILHGLNQCFEHVGAIIWCYSLFPNFLKVRDDLLMEEIHLDTFDPVAAPMAFYFNSVQPAPLSLPLVPSKNNYNNNNRNKNNNRCNDDNGGKHDNNSGNCYGNNSSNTTAASNGATTNNDWGPPPWSTYVNPW
jgi:hypothetical protein